MRILVVLILLAFGLQSQQTTVNGQQTLCTVPEPVEGTTLGASTSSATAYTRTVDCCPLTVDYYESQIRKADSLYKNYLPQYNFEEVKAAMEFFDSIRNEELAIRNYGRRKAIPNSTFLIPNYQCAKAHYYHAVGLTEKDDIVGACEHYLIALEIMEDMMAKDKSLKTKGKGLCDSASLRLCDSDEDYEKIRFVHLIHTRLAELFLNEGYYDLSIIYNKRALYYSYMLNDNLIQARTFKYIGHAFQLLNKSDSALYYYKESLNASADITNKLDVDKCIAQIMYFYKYEFDSAFMILKNNLNKIDNENVKYSYQYTLGNMYYNNKSYDSALYYLEKSLDNDIITKKLAFTTTLSAIYDSIGNYEKRAYYDNISNKLLKDNINKEVDKSKLQVLYNNYNERKTEKENAIAKAKTRNTTITISLVVLVAVMSVIIYIRYNHRKLHNELKKEIDIRTKDIESKNSIINQKEQLINEYHRTNESKDEIIVRQSEEIQNLINEKEHAKTYDIDAYYNSEICRKILGEKEEKYTALSASELSMLLDAANENLDNIINKIKARYPQLNTDDMYYICLIHLNISKNGISYLMNRSRKTVWLRIKTIKSYMNLDDNDDLLAFLKSIV